ncbi:hypothetical protein MKQ70_32425 [Chitinophaga sedimenti]|uniref:hypothetical protein n=1 Tax=Chitinophaga sedimenti TaxID=2033606 RepID=UPI002006416F|nr:hypothetical protein [Chitinophaga sedimenti]MCK7559424.1 hypothetical protein [Chitinophaga sedimenti]
MDHTNKVKLELDAIALRHYQNTLHNPQIVKDRKYLKNLVSQYDEVLNSFNPATLNKGEQATLYLMEVDRRKYQKAYDDLGIGRKVLKGAAEIAGKSVYKAPQSVGKFLNKDLNDTLRGAMEGMPLIFKLPIAVIRLASAVTGMVLVTAGNVLHKGYDMVTAPTPGSDSLIPKVPPGTQQQIGTGQSQNRKQSTDPSLSNNQSQGSTPTNANQQSNNQQQQGIPPNQPGTSATPTNTIPAYRPD